MIAAYVAALAAALVAYGALTRAAARPVPAPPGRGNHLVSPAATPPCPSPLGEKEGGTTKEADDAD